MGSEKPGRRRQAGLLPEPALAPPGGESLHLHPRAPSSRAEARVIPGAPSRLPLLSRSTEPPHLQQRSASPIPPLRRFHTRGSWAARVLQGPRGPIRNQGLPAFGPLGCAPWQAGHMSFDVCDGYFTTASGQEAQGAPLLTSTLSCFLHFKCWECREQPDQGASASAQLCCLFTDEETEDWADHTGHLQWGASLPSVKAPTREGVRRRQPRGGAGVRNLMSLIIFQ
ncbi:uncharacterized protein LOC120599613 [Pteropus medius]|uniref:uncharacterized protein LOC120599613 n=1 Tax=Pteropus vampyrus TaxID=132908 RepID=UPI00196AC709|nr:uncharacterized protein LOC120599613 [Pteropus giganteus]